LRGNEEVKIHREPNYWHFEGAGTGQEGVDICREYGISQPTILAVEASIPAWT
jgi:hypothetical protein